MNVESAALPFCRNRFMYWSTVQFMPAVFKAYPLVNALNSGVKFDVGGACLVPLPVPAATNMLNVLSTTKIPPPAIVS